MNSVALVMPEVETTILIVSAHAHLRKHYMSLLQEFPATVVAVTDGFEALAVMRSRAVHAVFCDYVLPGMNALALFLTMKEFLFPIPLVICSTDFSAKRREEALRIGVFRIVRKPTQRREIQTSIQHALEERERQLLQFYC